MNRCLDEIELTRAFSSGASAAVRAHLSTCAHCAESWQAIERVVGLARELPPVSLPAERIEHLRTQILARAQGAHRSARGGHRTLLALAAGLAAAVVAGALWTASTARRPAVRERGTVRALGAAELVRESGQPDEVVRLTEGTILVKVAPLGAGERFRVVTSDAEVEVHGTLFEVTAASDRLVSVRVRHGIVEVRARHQAPAFLREGERWDAPVPPVAPAPIARPDVTPAVKAIARDAVAQRAIRRAPPPPAATHEPPVRGLDELLFEEGWNALRAGDPAAAAPALERAFDARPDGPLAEDASFWHAVALARAGQRTAAGSALARYLDRFGGAARAGEASAMLGWLLLEQGDVAEAERRFSRAKDDPVPSVRDSARRGLAETERRRARP